MCSVPPNSSWLVSQNGPALVSQNGPALVSQNGPALVSQNGPALVSQNGPALETMVTAVLSHVLQRHVVSPRLQTRTMPHGAVDNPLTMKRPENVDSRRENRM